MARARAHAGTLGSVWREVRHQHRLFWRNPTSVLFTIALPILTLPLVHGINRQAVVLAPGVRGPGGAVPGIPFEEGVVSFAQYLTPVAAAFSVAVACFANLAVRTAMAREKGILKRVRGSPLRPAVYLSGHIGSSVTVALLLAAGAVAAGVLYYDVQVVGRLLPAAVLTLIVGTACFCTLGLALSAMIPNADAAPAVAFGAMIPLGFLSSVFFPPQIAPEWMRRLGEVLPLEPFASALFSAFSPHTPGPGIEWGELAKLVGWGLAAGLFALRFFSWSPRPEARRAP